MKASHREKTHPNERPYPLEISSKTDSGVLILQSNMDILLTVTNTTKSNSCSRESKPASSPESSRQPPAATVFGRTIKTPHCLDLKL